MKSEKFYFNNSEFEIINVARSYLGMYCIVGIKSENVVFTGDAIFSLGCGRLFEGSPNAYVEFNM